MSDKIISRPYSQEGEDTWDRVFKKKCNHFLINYYNYAEMCYMIYCTLCKKEIEVSPVDVEITNEGAFINVRAFEQFKKQM